MSLLEVRSLPKDVGTEGTDQDTQTDLHMNTDLGGNTDRHTDTHSNTPSDTNTHTDDIKIDTLSVMQTDTLLNLHPNTYTNGTQPESQLHTFQSSHTQQCLTDTLAGHVSMALHDQETEGVVFKAACVQTNNDDDGDEEDHRPKDAVGDSGSSDAAQMPEDSGSSPIVIPRWNRRQLPPVPPGLEYPRISPPIPPRGRPKPPTLLPQQPAPVLGGNSEKSPGFILRPPGPVTHASLPNDTSALYASIIHKFKQRLPHPQPCPPLEYPPQEKEGGHFCGTGSIPIEESPQLMEQETEGVYRVREMAVVDVSGETGAMTTAPIPKPPQKNRPNLMLKDPMVGTQEGPDTEACAGSVVEARRSLQALHLAPSGAESVNQPREMLSASEDQGSGILTAAVRLPEPLIHRVPELSFEHGRLDQNGTQRDRDRDEGTGMRKGLQERQVLPNPPVAKTARGKMKKLACKMINSLKEEGEEKQSHRTIMEGRGVLETESSLFNAQMSIFEEDERSQMDEEEDEERKSAEESNRSLVGELEEEKGQRQPVCHQSSISSLSSFRLFYNPTSLIDEILTGDEWSSYLSVNSNPSSTQYTGQSEVETQPLSGKDQPESVPVPLVTISDHSDEGNHRSAMDLPDYKLTSQSDEGALANKKQDAAQEEVKNERSGRDVGVMPKAVLASGAKQQIGPVNKTKGIYDDIDLYCVKSLGVLDSSPQKHRIYLNKKRKSRRPLRKPRRDIFKIPRFGVLKTAAHPPVRSSSPPLSSSSSHSPSLSPLSAHSPSPPSNGFFSSSIFYPAPSTPSPLSPLPNSEEGSRLNAGQDRAKYGSSSPRSLAKFISNLKDKAKRKNKQ